MNLLLDHRRAPGDIVMMTCAVRDLHRAMPGKYRTGVATTAMPLWEHNPDVAQVPTQSKLLKIGYGSSVHQTNQRAGHFAGAFNRHLSEMLRVPIPLTELRGALYLSEAERDPSRCPMPRPYWVIAAGGKSDFTAKLWDQTRWQAVVSALGRDTQLVQVGAPPTAAWKQVGARVNRLTQFSPALTGVISHVGHTSMRQLLPLIYHSEGVICLVSFPMHIAAALNKPCIVIAGGREPWWWEAYTQGTWEANCSTPAPADFVEHRYLHTMGQLPCCGKTGCWRSGLGERPGSNCSAVVREGQPQPKCMTLITPEQVVAAFNDYRNKVPVPYVLPPAWLKPPLLKEPLPPALAPTRNRVEVQPAARKPLVKYTCRTPEGIVVTNRPAGTRVIHPPARVVVNPAPAPRKVYQPARTASAPAVRPAPQLTRAPAPTPAASTGATMKLPLTLCVLIYGDYLDLISRCLNSIWTNMPAAAVQMRLGMNAVSDRVREWVLANKRENMLLYDSRENLRKYPMMRRMFSEPAISTEWIMWMDDDSHIVKPDFLGRLGAQLQRAPADYLGKPYYVTLKQGQIDWIRKATWYRGKRWLLHRGSVPKVDFATGGFWLIRSAVVRKLNWPDPRISHNFGDVSLGEAVRQNDYRFGHYSDGITVNDAPRRGVSEQYPVG